MISRLTALLTMTTLVLVLWTALISTVPPARATASYPDPTLPYRAELMTNSPIPKL